jgi:hypothetical protein
MTEIDLFFVPRLVAIAFDAEDRIKCENSHFISEINDLLDSRVNVSESAVRVSVPKPVPDGQRPARHRSGGPPAAPTPSSGKTGRGSRSPAPVGPSRLDRVQSARPSSTGSVDNPANAIDVPARPPSRWCGPARDPTMRMWTDSGELACDEAAQSRLRSAERGGGR